MPPPSGESLCADYIAQCRLRGLAPEQFLVDAILAGSATATLADAGAEDGDAVDCGGGVDDDCTGSGLYDGSLRERARTRKQTGLVLRPPAPVLRLSGHALDSATCATLSSVLARDSFFRSVVLADAFLGDEGAASVCHALRGNRHVQYLDLRSNNIQRAGACALAVLLRASTTLRTVVLEWNSIGLYDDAMRELGEGVAVSPSLRDLDLRNNKIGPHGAQLFVEALRGSSGSTSLPSLRRLDLRWNNIGWIGGKALLNLLSWNTALIDLELVGNDLSEPMLASIRLAINRNRATAGVGSGSQPGSPSALQNEYSVTSPCSECSGTRHHFGYSHSSYYLQKQNQHGQHLHHCSHHQHDQQKQHHLQQRRRHASGSGCPATAEAAATAAAAAAADAAAEVQAALSTQRALHESEMAAMRAELAAVCRDAESMRLAAESAASVAAAAELADCRAALHDCDLRLTAANARCDELAIALEATREEARQAAGRAARELADARSTAEDYRRAAATAESARAAAESVAAQRARERDDLREHADRITAAASTAASEHAAVVRELERRIADYERQLSSMRGALDSRASEYEAAIRAAENRAAAAASEAENARRAADARVTETERRHESEMRALRDELNREIQIAKASRDAQKAEADRMRSAAQEAAREVDAERNARTADATAAAEKISALNAQLVSLRSELSEARESARSATERARDLRAERDALARTSERAEATADALRAELERMRVSQRDQEEAERRRRREEADRLKTLEHAFTSYVRTSDQNTTTAVSGSKLAGSATGVSYDFSSAQSPSKYVPSSNTMRQSNTSPHHQI